MSDLCIGLFLRCRSAKFDDKLARHPIERIDAKQWAYAEKVASDLSLTLSSPLTRKHAACVAKLLRIGVTMVYQHCRRLREAGVASAVPPRGVGYPVAQSRLDQAQEALLMEVVNRVIRRAKRAPVIDVVAEVERRCSAAKLALPTRRTIDRRLERFAPQWVI